MDYPIILTWLDCLSVFLLVTASQRISSEDATNPYIIEHPEDQFVVAKEPAKLNCKAEGNPPPIITWYRNGQQVVTSTADGSSHRMLLPNGQLFFLRIVHNKNNRSDVGVYYCNATNPETHFSVISRNATLDIAVIREDFREVPLGREVAVGMETVFNCRAPRGDPEPKVKWRKNGRPLAITPGDHRIYFDDALGSLHIRATQKDDAGSYVCVAHNVAGERESTAARLQVREKPRIIGSPQDAVVKEDSDALFECQVVGDPNPAVLWRRQNGQIPSDRSHIMTDKSLRIQRAQVSDEGVYICKVENSVGIQEAEARLTVHSPPKIVKAPRSMVVGIGRQVSFLCEVTGNPSPTLFWNKDSSQVFMFPNSNDGRISVTEDGRLVIRSLKVEDSGEYSCQAINLAGSVVAKATLQVRADDFRLPPIIQHGPLNQTLPINSVATLFCSVSGDPVPRILWLKNGRVLPMHDSRFMIIDGGTLQISDLRRMDSGLYTCLASSETGETNWNATVNVEAPTDSAIVFHRSPQLSAFPGSPSRIMLSNVTETTMRMSWRPSVNFGALAVTSFLVECFSPDTGEGWSIVTDYVREQSLVVQNLRPNTRYVFLVRARNSHGFGPPSQPSVPEKTLGEDVVQPITVVPSLDLDLVSDKLSSQILSSPFAIALSSTAVNVTWKTLHNWNYIEGFYIKYRPVENSDDAGNSQREEYIVDAINSNMAAQYILTGLKKFTWYDVCVQPFYRSVKGSTSNTVRVQTLEDVPSASPRSVQVRVVDNNTLQATWEQPPHDQLHGRLLGYKVYVYDETRLIREIQVNSTMESVDVHNLAKSSRYSVQVSAYNKMGEGIKSESVYASEQKFVNEPWFLATVIGTVGGVLWVSLCLFSLVLYRKHKAQQRLNKNGSAAVSNTKAVDNYQLHPVRGDPPYATHGHQQLVTSSSSLMPCACNQTLVSSCCYNESLSDGEYKVNGDQLSANHTYYTLETPTPQMNSDVNHGKPPFHGKNLPMITPYATVPVGNCGPADNLPRTPDGVFRPILGGPADVRENWNQDIDSSQYNSSYEDGINRMVPGQQQHHHHLHPTMMKQPVLFLPPPPGHPPVDESGGHQAPWMRGDSRIQPPVYDLSGPLHQINKSHNAKVLPNPRDKNLGTGQQQLQANRNAGQREAQPLPRYTIDYSRPGTKAQPPPPHPAQGPTGHPGFQPSDYAIKPGHRRPHFPENNADKDVSPDDSHPYINEPASSSYSVASSTSSTSAVDIESKDPGFSQLPLSDSAAEGETDFRYTELCPAASVNKGTIHSYDETTANNLKNAAHDRDTSAIVRTKQTV